MPQRGVLLLVLGLLTTVVAACGGGGSDPSPTISPTPGPTRNPRGLAICYDALDVSAEIRSSVAQAMSAALAHLRENNSLWERAEIVEGCPPPAYRGPTGGPTPDQEAFGQAYGSRVERPSYYNLFVYVLPEDELVGI